MAEVYSFGLTSIKMGDPDTEGAMGTTLTEIGKVVQDTADLTSADPSTDEVFSEQDDTPLKTFYTKGVDTLKFGIFDCSPDTLVKVLGGTKDGTAPDESWNAPVSTPDILQSIAITTKGGLLIQIPAGKVIGKLNYQFRKRGLVQVDVSVNIEAPADGSAPITIGAAV